MEDVLDVYKRPYDPGRPVVCMDEMPRQLIGEIRTPVSARRGQAKRIDYEYVRKGTADAFMFFSPLHGWRRVSVRSRRTALDWAEEVRVLVDEDFPESKKIVLVMDNLNTHKIASLYTAFTPEEAHRLASKLEIHYTPKHGSWLNIAEMELSILSRQALNKRMEDMETFAKRAESWTKKRNEKKGTVDWQFTTENARIKLKKLYPSIMEN